jgi:hypothetical protein
MLGPDAAAMASSSRFSLRSANQTTSFFLVSGFQLRCVPGIDAQPVVRDAEVIEMLNLICLAV